ncbi:MAG: cyclase family protein [Nitrospirota bacterium]
MTIENGMAVYPGDPGVELTREKRIEDGDSANLSRYCLGSHTGTHMDPPFHFNTDGATIDMLPLGSMVGPALVLEVPGDEITRSAIEGNLGKAERVLFKTKNAHFGKGGFRQDFAYLAEDAALYLVELGVMLVGIDYLSIEKFHSKTHAVHRTLLHNRVVVVEGLDLSGVGPGRYDLICLPLRIKGGDGSPVRAILIEP